MQVTYSHDYPPDTWNKFDLACQVATVDEERLGGLLQTVTMECVKLIELKTEKEKWQTTGNIFIETECNGKPSGLSATKSHYWFTELDPLGCYFVFAVEHLKRLCDSGRFQFKRNVGDGGRVCGYVIPLRVLTDPGLLCASA